MAKKLGSLDMKMGSLFFSRDKLLFLATFFKNNYSETDCNNKHIATKLSESREIILKEFPEDEKEVDHYLGHIDNDFVFYGTPNRLAITYRMIRHMLRHEGVSTKIEPLKDSPIFRLNIGLKGIEILYANLRDECMVLNCAGNLSLVKVTTQC